VKKSKGIIWEEAHKYGEQKALYHFCTECCLNRCLFFRYLDYQKRSMHISGLLPKRAKLNNKKGVMAKLGEVKNTIKENLPSKSSTEITRHIMQFVHDNSLHLIDKVKNYFKAFLLETYTRQMIDSTIIIKKARFDTKKYSLIGLLLSNGPSNIICIQD